MYGPSGVGKYTQALMLIRKFSPSKLKYEKRIIINYTTSNKPCQYICKISDIHYEVDMSLLGCNAKSLWHEIFSQINDIVGGTPNKTGIILCKNMHTIHNDLLDVLYSYMQPNHISQHISLKYIFITESISFIPENIVNCCEQICIPKPEVSIVKEHVKIYNNVLDTRIQNTTNIKSLYTPHTSRQDMQVSIIQNIITLITSDIQNIIFVSVRESLYDLFVYDINIPYYIWTILSLLIESEWITDDLIHEALQITYTFFKLYNNNYRPIYHVESYLYKIINLCNKNDT